MRVFFLILTLFINLLANELSGLSEKLLINNFYTVNKNMSDYNLKLKVMTSENSLNTLTKFQNNLIDIAIIRGDILGIKNSGLHNFELFSDYGIIAQVDSSYLFLISKKDINSIYDLRAKNVSIGNISNISQIYLKDIAKNAGVLLDINFKTLSKRDSIKALKNDQVDAIFIFAPKRYMNLAKKNGLKVISLPKDFFKYLTITKGVKVDKLKFNKKSISTLSIPNFVIAHPFINPEDLEALVYGFKSSKNLQRIDSFYGKIHDGFFDALLNSKLKKAKQKIQKAKRDAIEFKFVDRVKYQNETRFLYSIRDNSEFDINVTFDYFKTKDFDKSPIKPRHLLKILPDKVILKSNSERVISISYSNPFNTRVDAKVNLVFINESDKENKIEIPLIIGDNL